MPLRLRIFPVAVSPTHSSTLFDVVFRKAKCFPFSLHSSPLIFAPGGVSILISEPSAMRLSVRPTEYWKRNGELDAGLMRRPAIRNTGCARSASGGYRSAVDRITLSFVGLTDAPGVVGAFRMSTTSLGGFL